jgi:DNA-binding NtrC family response regulator
MRIGSWAALAAASYGGLFTFLASSSFIFIKVLHTPKPLYGLLMSSVSLAYILGTIVCRRLSQALTKEGFEVEAFTTARAFLERMQEEPFEVVFLDLRLPDEDGLSVLDRVKALRRGAEVVMVTGHGGIDTAIQAIKQGAFHYVTKPAKLEEIRHLARQALEKTGMRQENQRLRAALRGGALADIVGNSPALQQVFALIRKVAPVDCNVLLQGASGTGCKAFSVGNSTP